MPMSEEKPKDIDEYKKWLKTDHKEEISDRTATYYDSVTARIKQIFEKSEFWTSVNSEFGEIDAGYRLKHGYPLWFSPTPPKLETKPFESFLLKTFRKNVIENRQWPHAPKEGGWLLPNNWFSRVNDLVRTIFVVKYLDGVEFLLAAFQSRCTSCKLDSHPYLEARWEGYYAAHLYVYGEFEVPKLSWDTQKIRTSVELQITTQLQEAIRQLTRKYYEERRQRLKPPDTKWQWNYSSEEFIPNYLGHILHYLEGMIMEVREKQRSVK
jgi:hypothetical protein